MSKLDFLIPDSVLTHMAEDRLELAISLTPTAARDSWPRIKIQLDDLVVNESTLYETSTIVYKLPKKLRDSVQIKIEYLGKTDNDTVVNSAGEIVENQSVTINSVFINNTDIVKTGAIYKLGIYTRILSDNTLRYFQEHGIDHGPNHSLVMSENGSWDLNLTFPINKQLIELTAIKKKHELWLDNDILLEIHDTINQIRQLRKRILQS